MNRFLNSCTIYLGIRCLYGLQGVLYASGGIISRFLLLIYMLLSIYFALLVIMKYKMPTIMRGITMFSLVLVLYGVFSLFNTEILYATNNIISKTDYMKSVILSFGPVYACFHFTKQKLLTESTIKFWVLVFFVIATLSYFRFQQEAINATDQETITNNMAYSFVSLLPCVYLFYKKSSIQYLIMLYCIVFILMGMKRGAILIGVIAILYIIYSIIKTLPNKHKGTSIFLAIIFLFILIIIFQNTLYNNDYFMARVESTLEGNTSGRDELYSSYFNYFISERNFMYFIFGHGADGTLRLFHEYAHNDWLELAINQGVLGISVYLFYWTTFIKSVVEYKRHKVIQNFLVLFIIIFLLKSLFSMSYSMPIYASAILGYFIATADTYKKNVIL